MNSSNTNAPKQLSVFFYWVTVLLPIIFCYSIYSSGVLPEAYVKTLSQYANIFLMVSFPFVVLVGFLRLLKHSAVFVILELIGLFEIVFFISALVSWIVCVWQH